MADEKLDEKFKTEDPAYLEAIVKAHEKKVHTIMSAAETFARELGKTVSYEEHNYHTHVVKELKDFHDFDITTDMGHSVMGGNDINIAYKGMGVLEVYYQASYEDAQVRDYETTGEWEKHFMKYASNPEKYVKEFKVKIDEEKKLQEKERKKVMEEAQKREELKAKAKRLGLL